MKNKPTLAAFKKVCLFILKSGLFLIPLLFIVDVASKLLFEHWLLTVPKQSYVIIPNFFSFTLTYNQGAAWGIFAGQDWLLITFSVVAGILLSVFLGYRYKSLSTHMKIGLMLMIPGAFGNLIDRAFYSKGVIDFLHFTFIDFPIFNLADCYLVIGVFFLIIGEVIQEILERTRKKMTSTNNKAMEDVKRRVEAERLEEKKADDEQE